MQCSGGTSFGRRSTLLICTNRCCRMLSSSLLAALGLQGESAGFRASCRRVRRARCGWRACGRLVLRRAVPRLHGTMGSSVWHTPLLGGHFFADC